MQHSRLMIYGAYGYTGALITEAALAAGLSPVLAGRDFASLGVMAEPRGLVFRVFELDADTLVEQLADIDVVIHCAGPFVNTAPAMVAACLASGTHYLDITGEIDVFEHVFARHEAAATAGVVLCPGAGFDVVPTDCLAARLAEDMPDASRLALGFDSRSGLSPGTAKTTVDALAGGGRVRRNGQIETVKLAADVRRIDFGNGEKAAMTIPWGDVSTAYRSTGIGDIAVYIPMSPARIKQIRRLNWIRPVLGLGPVMNRLKQRAARTQGPDAASRARQPTHVWGEVRNPAGACLAGRIQVANGYALTADASLALARRLLDPAHRPAGGAYTPSQLAGWEFVESLPGSGRITLDAA